MRRRSTTKAPITPPTIAPTLGRLAAWAVSVTAGVTGSPPSVDVDEANAPGVVEDALSGSDL